MILNPSGIHGIWQGFFEASPSLGAWMRYLLAYVKGDSHCLQQLQVHPDCHLVAEFYEAPSPETKPNYKLTAMFMSLSVTDRCLNTIRVVQGKGKNENANLPM
jgi:hypothetical protein